MIPYVFEAVREKPYMNFLRTIKVNLCKRDLSREIPRIPFPQFPNKSIACMWRMSSPYALSLLKHTEKVRWFCIKGRLRPIIRQTFGDSLSGLWASNTHSFSISLEVKTSLVLFCFVNWRITRVICVTNGREATDRLFTHLFYSYISQQQQNFWKW